MKVAMVPSPRTLASQRPSGITTVVAKYAEYLPEVGIEVVSPDEEFFDLAAVHAGTAPPPPPGVPFVAHCHGLYWSAHYKVEEWEMHGNREVLNNIRASDVVTVPSDWVAKTFRRDMHLDPFIVPHGVELDEWNNDKETEGFVLWNKNRSSDVCSPRAVHELASLRPDQLFLTTFTDSEPTPNIKVTGLLPYDTMREIIKIAGVYLATVEETFGIGTLEAMAAGIPILGFSHGGTAELVEHGVNGYLARTGDYEDLAVGLDYCQRYRRTLGDNGKSMAAAWSWSNVAIEIRSVYESAIESFSRPFDCSVVIPCYNKAETLERAVVSALGQGDYAAEIIIVDNNSDDTSAGLARELSERHGKVHFVRESRQGVAHARNKGIREGTSRYICCLDADDEMLPGFLEVCVEAFKLNQHLGIVYTKMEVVLEDGSRQVSDWPGNYDFANAVRKQNQVPTCCVFRRDIFNRLGGYRQRYAPIGAGAEDAELWYRFGKAGYGGALVSEEPLFRYYLGGIVSGDKDYREPNYLLWHTETLTGDHPCASLAPPGIHLVKKYNNPSVSVIIPFTFEHIEYVWDAIDSLEGQTYRNWECILVYDGGIDENSEWDWPEEVETLIEAYPFATVVNSDGPGSGAARNTGVSVARANYLLFLDADDWLEPLCLEAFLAVSSDSPDDILYSDYIGRAYGVTNTDELERTGRLLHYEEDEGYAIIRYFSADYDCDKALRQPEMLDNGQFYIWNLITSLTPKVHHEAIGGFDETMESWEDWDYWLRMARAGFCFTRIDQPLVSYRFYTGTRREIGRQRAEHLINYLREKYEGDEPMACGGCGKRRASPVMAMQTEQPIAAYSSSDMVRVEFIGDSFGESVTVRDLDTNQIHDYGYRAGGATFFMLRKHADRFPQRFRVIEDVGAVQAAELPEPVEPVDPPSEPVATMIEEPKPKAKRTTRKRTTKKRATKPSSS